MKSMVICSFLLKKLFPIVLLAISCLSQGIAQERKRITNHDENGTIISAGEIDVYDDKIDTVWVRRFDSNGTKIEEKKFKNGELNGAWKGWYSNRSKKYRIRYKNGVIHGTSEHFDSTGLTIIQKKYKNGTLHGKQREWYSNGELLKVVVYKLGMINGVYNEWWDNGAKKVEGLYWSNKKEGLWTYYDPGRRSRYNFYHSDELLASYDFEYYANGQLKEEPSFNKDGVREGEWIQYF
ncbi:MAG TPA: toxin-antitoxin system YwqK family antitoxin, partial [Candidatus Marinimicrobia bacterium]|nr:toxin-antitoxin system YwqK family antitoxin [Candidatus Neomarinimicrobiota bacterium]